MALTFLPTELLSKIILYTLPEGFESVALTCKQIHAICKPFIQSHNTLRMRFRDFNYYENTSDVIKTIRTAFDLITRIAVEPVVARYIWHADFAMDSRFTRGRPRELLADVHCGGAVLRLLADSPHLRQAGLDWQEFYVKIEEDLEAVRYSQHAAAFLMTLLPNVEQLALPRRWKPLEATDKLIDVIVQMANQSHLPNDEPSLAQVTRFGPSVSLVPQDRFDLDWVNSFLALPNVRSFRGPSCVAIGDDGHMTIPSNVPRFGFGKTLTVIDLVACCIDELGIADFLQHTTRLRTLRYSHLTKTHSGPLEWNLCKFISAIESKVGSHLEELSITIRELRGSLAAGRVSMRGFQRLQRLKIPLEVAVCNKTTATTGPAATSSNTSLFAEGVSTDERHKLIDDVLFISDLVPASVAQLSLISGGTDDHAKALDVMFQHFAVKKESTLPVLEKMQLSFPDSAGDAYKEQCVKLLVETKKFGVIMHLERWPSCICIAWDRDQ